MKEVPTQTDAKRETRYFIYLVLSCLTICGGFVYHTVSSNAGMQTNHEIVKEVLRNDLKPETVMGDALTRSGRQLTDGQACVVIFSDYQCPACLELEQKIPNAQAIDGGKYLFLRRHYPLKSHPQSFLSACAAEAARRQGRFADMHKFLIDSDGAMTSETISKFVISSSLDSKRYYSDFKKEAPMLVKRDIVDGNRVGLRHTPTIFVCKRGQVFEVPTMDVLLAMGETK